MREQSLSEFVRKLADEFGGGDKHASKHVSDWNHFGKTAFLERYLTNNIHVCLHGRIRFGDENPEHFVAVFRNLAAHRTSKADNRSSGLYPEFSSLSFVGPEVYPLAHSGSCGHNKKEAMFVSDIKLMQDGKEIVVRSGLEIRLGVGYQLFRSGADPLYASAVDGLFKFIFLPADWKLMIVQGPLAILDGKGNDEMIEGRSNMVDYFASDNRESQRKHWGSFDPKNVVSSIVFKLTNDFTRYKTSLKKGVDFTIEIDDALVGPLKFCPDAF